VAWAPRITPPEVRVIGHAVAVAVGLLFTGATGLAWFAWVSARKLLDKMIDEEYESSAALVGDVLVILAARTAGDPERWSEDFLDTLRTQRAASGKPELPTALALLVKSAGIRRSRYRRPSPLTYVLGLSSLLLAAVLVTIGFLTRGASSDAQIVSIAPVALTFIVVGTKFSRSVRAHPPPWASMFVINRQLRHERRQIRRRAKATERV
jgi:hypothetical protein